MRNAIGVLALALTLAVAPAPRALAQAVHETDDDFIESLGDESIRTPVDRKRLARTVFSLAATLDGGKSSVQLLHGSVVVPESSRRAVRSLLRTRYDNYARSLARFKDSVTDWLDEPYSTLRLHRALVDGQQSKRCNSRSTTG